METNTPFDTKQSTLTIEAIQSSNGDLSFDLATNSHL